MSDDHQTLTLDMLREALVGLVDHEYVLMEMFSAYTGAYTPARAVTEKEAAERELQKVVWVEEKEGDLIRFRENVLVSKLLPHWRTEIPVEPWMEEQFTRLQHPETGNSIVRYLVENGPHGLNHLATQGFCQKDSEQFAMLIGYSISGAGELSYFSDAMYSRAAAEYDKRIAERKNMGVDCSAVSGFGVLLTEDELETAFKKLGITFDHDEGYLELCDHYGLSEPRRMGTAYRERGIEYLFYATSTSDPKTGDTKTDPEQVATLKRMAEELGVAGPSFHEGEYWH